MNIIGVLTPLFCGVGLTRPERQIGENVRTVVLGHLQLLRIAQVYVTDTLSDLVEVTVLMTPIISRC